MRSWPCSQGRPSNAQRHLEWAAIFFRPRIREPKGFTRFHRLLPTAARQQLGGASVEAPRVVVPMACVSESRNRLADRRPLVPDASLFMRVGVRAVDRVWPCHDLCCRRRLFIAGAGRSAGDVPPQRPQGLNCNRRRSTSRGGLRCFVPVARCTPPSQRRTTVAVQRPQGSSGCGGGSRAGRDRQADGLRLQPRHRNIRLYG